MRERYGASPLHLLAHLVALPLVAFALLQIARSGTAVAIFTWLIASVILHDLVLLPFYSAIDRVERGRRGAPSTTCACRRCSRGCCCSCSFR